MKEQKPEPAAQDLRDRPVPPVKGAVTDLQDICLRPQNHGAKQVIDPENWL